MFSNILKSDELIALLKNIVALWKSAIFSGTLKSTTKNILFSGILQSATEDRMTVIFLPMF
jgi:hypothetical protein